MSSLLPIDRLLGAALAALILCAASACRADTYAGSPVALTATRADAAASSGGMQQGQAAQPAESLTLTMSARMQSAAGHVLQSAKDITDSALDLIGVRYKFGGQSPERGMDCSGFVKYVFEQVTGVALPHSAREQSKVGEIIGLDQLKPGDLVFFNTLKRTFSHVGIYVGEGKFIHSPRPGGEVRVEDMRFAYWHKRFTGARRVDSLAEVQSAAPAVLTVAR